MDGGIILSPARDEFDDLQGALQGTAWFVRKNPSAMTELAQ